MSESRTEEEREPPVRILLVDDNPANLLALEGVLEPLAQELVRAQSGAEALEKLSERDFALVLMDVHMPVLDGFQTVEAIRKRNELKHLPVMFLTALFKDTQSAARGYALGAVDFIMKPFEPEILRSKVGAFVTLYQYHQRLKRHQQRLAEEMAARALSEERFQLLVSSVTDYAIFMLDPDGRVKTWNEGAERIKGYRADEIIGEHFSIFYPEEAARTAMCERELEIAKREGRFEDEGWRVRKDGSRFWAGVIITPIYDPNRTFLGFAKVTRDLTERKRAEDERIRHLQLQERSRIVEQVSRTKDEFVAILGHDLRNPLNVIMMTARNHAQRPSAPEPCRDVGQRILKSGQWMNRLISDVLDLTRSRLGGGISVERRPADMEQLCRDSIGELQMVNPECHISLEVAGDMTGQWDPDRVVQVVTNLVGNAITHGRCDDEIHVSLRGIADAVVLEVHNSGAPIPAAKMERLFEPFTRGDNKGEGLGLGLYIAQQIVVAHGGKITAESTEGDGTTFRVHWPRRLHMSAQSA